MSHPARTRPPLSHGLALVALCLATMLPGVLATPVVDRDEARFAQASRQMFESVALPAGDRDPPLHDGGVVVPRIGAEPRINKPPLIYWLQSASAAVLTGGDPSRDAIWMYRLPSLVAASGTVLLTWLLAFYLWNPGRDAARIALWAGAMLALCPIFAWDARQARADQVMVACAAAAMAALWWASRRSQRGGPAFAPHAMLWLAVTLGVLAKGPITPMVVGLTLIAHRLVTGRALVPWRWAAAGVVAVGLLLTPWLLAVGEAIGWERLGAVFHDEVIARSASAKEGHAGPPGYHLVLAPALFWPGSLLTAWAVLVAVRRVRRAQRVRAQAPPEAFLLAWIVPAWVVFELVSTKLPHYTMPLYPAVAVLSARALVVAMRLLRRRSERAAKAHPPGVVGWWIWAAIGLGWLIAVPVVVGWPGWSDASAWPSPGVRMGRTGLVAAVFVVFAWFVLRAARARRLGLATFAGLAGIAVSHAFVPPLLLAPHRELWVTERVVQTLERAGWTPGEPVAAVGYHEDSLMFAARGRLERLPGNAAPDHSAVNARFLVAPAVRPAPAGFREAGVVRGFNYSNGNRVRLRVLVRGAEEADR